MYIFADGNNYEADCDVHQCGHQVRFYFTSCFPVKYDPNASPAISVKYGRVVFNQRIIRELSGRVDDFSPRIFLDGYEKAGAFNNRF